LRITDEPLRHAEYSWPPSRVWVNLLSSWHLSEETEEQASGLFRGDWAANHDGCGDECLQIVKAAVKPVEIDVDIGVDSA
jgi:hypothetical protein